MARSLALFSFFKKMENGFGWSTKKVQVGKNCLLVTEICHKSQMLPSRIILILQHKNVSMAMTSSDECDGGDYLGCCWR